MKKLFLNNLKVLFPTFVSIVLVYLLWDKIKFEYHNPNEGIGYYSIFKHSALNDNFRYVFFVGIPILTYLLSFSIVNKLNLQSLKNVFFLAENNRSFSWRVSFIRSFKFLEKLKNDNFYFGNTLSLGKINNLIKKEEFQMLKIKISNAIYADDILINFFNLKSLNALEYSPLKQANILHALNQPIENLDEQFDTILDFGTSEHVFNIFQCLKNISHLCKINGHIIHCLPANNNCGHGFW
jgi:hypothetical protein